MKDLQDAVPRLIQELRDEKGPETRKHVLSDGSTYESSFTTYCDRPKIFRINGMPADCEQFGTSEDIGDIDDAPDYGCANRQFVRSAPERATLLRYSITVKEYGEICDILSEVMGVGCCAECE